MGGGHYKAPALLSVDAAAAMLGVTPSAVRVAAWRGRLPVAARRPLRFRPADVLAYMEGRRGGVFRAAYGSRRAGSG